MNELEIIKKELEERINNCKQDIRTNNYKLEKMKRLKNKIDDSNDFFKKEKKSCIFKSIFFSLNFSALSFLLSTIKPQFFASISILTSFSCFTIIEALVYINKTKNLKKIVKNTNYELLCKEIDYCYNLIKNNEKKLNMLVDVKKRINILIKNEEKIRKNEIIYYQDIKQKINKI